MKILRFNRRSGAVHHFAIPGHLHLKPLTLVIPLMALLLWACDSVAGTITQVMSRDALGGDDYVDWAQLPQPDMFLPLSFLVTSNNGLTAQVVGPAELFSNRQADPSIGVFGMGEFLVETKSYLEIMFAQPVRGVGAHLGRSFCRCPIVAELVLFDTSHLVLASLTTQGPDKNPDGDAVVFLGAVDTEAEIKSARFYVKGVAPEQIGDTFAINRLDLVATIPVDQASARSQQIP